MKSFQILSVTNDLAARVSRAAKSAGIKPQDMLNSLVEESLNFIEGNSKMSVHVIDNHVTVIFEFDDHLNIKEK